MIDAGRGFRWLVHEPFFQFLALGLLLWGVYQYTQTHDDRYVIRIGSAERERLAMTYRQQFGQAPTSEALKQLIDRRIREEIFLREGLALGLDRDDEIVRRRIVQKYEFLETDLAVPASPDPETLKRWFERNQARYLTPERVAFSQVYFSVDRDGEQAAKGRALATLDKLRAWHVTRAPTLGDAFPGPADVSALAPDEAARLFGESDLSQQLFKAPVGQWAGPYRSGYGWHLVCVTARAPPALPPWPEIRERVLVDYQDEQRRLANISAFEKLKAQYTIIL